MHIEGFVKIQPITLAPFAMYPIILSGYPIAHETLVDRTSLLIAVDGGGLLGFKGDSIRVLSPNVRFLCSLQEEARDADGDSIDS